ncbi:hypothetical protein [Crateriforma spongiae]|uniref:hypothetical protein n=1 Tax=Crateriforma spongiae TaxID=2724528 RepID=UPI001447E357|nr:hypothetical protein [Crateriforma spongiae]
MQHAESGVAGFVEDCELDRSVFERADGRSPTVVVAGRCVGFRFLERDGQVFDVFDLGAIDGEDGVESEDDFSRHRVGVPFRTNLFWGLSDGIPPKLGKLGSVGVERRLHERSLGVAARFFGTATLVLFVDQSASTVGLRGGSQFDANKSAIAKRANRPVLANAKTMPFEPPAFASDSTEFV